ncbi:polyhydroxyalkanoic acid system family protein [Variovorax ginsengisoli]|uniref:Polyhydroxyalkanoate system protein n=1 Tax=Variovorax ginsengisoli TaxID=363844 RepID=A0ABT9SFD4_9BURK|nr:polyhydroxyalkanoic acid system family protein [Variovorax ginsengisoli]MDP9902062.1 putative polyhydroxyalkanoate system protein [Variovorax ginsengisoli]
MADIHIERNHALGLDRARAVCRQWVEEAEKDFGLACTWTPGEAGDTVEFKRVGIEGKVHVTGDVFVVDMQLGFLLDAFSDAIKDKVTRNLDRMIDAPPHAA